jgi:HSP20 family molecular chaperone IbpA
MVLRNRLTDDFFDGLFSPTFNTMFESDLSRNESGDVIMEIDVPGFNKENLSIEVVDGIMTIQGETEKRKIFKRYSLNGIEDINASIKDGVLTLIFAEQKKVVKKIELQDEFHQTQIEHKEEKEKDDII